MPLKEEKQEDLILETDLLIIGAGPVGIFASFQAGLVGMKSVIVDALTEIGGQLNMLYPNKFIYDIPGFPSIIAKDLVERLYNQAKEYNPKYLLNQKIDKLHKSTEGFSVTTSKNNTIKAKAIIIAGGAGIFTPQKLPLKNIEHLENKHIFYNVTNPNIFKDKTVIVMGGGDSAVDWALQLSNNIASKLYLVHRRKHFRALPSSVSNLETLSKESYFKLLAPYAVKSINKVNDEFCEVAIQNLLSKEEELIKVNCIIPLFGLSRSLDALNDWGLKIDEVNSTIIADSTTFETNIKGIYAVGDIAKYEHKLKLIMVGFSEVAYAVHSAWKYVFPNKVFHFFHSTSKKDS